MDNISNGNGITVKPNMELPGFRFHPTEEELLNYYLKKVVSGKKRFNIIAFLNIYHHEPWELPGLARLGEREWYFFVPRDKKHGHGGRPNRTTEKGFWKATGSDRPIRFSSDPKTVFGHRKTLVFYKGRAPRGSKTDWVMNEYRLLERHYSSPEEDIVLCKIYRKATSMKILEQRAAMTTPTPIISHVPPIQPQPQENHVVMITSEGTTTAMDSVVLKKEEDRYESEQNMSHHDHVWSSELEQNMNHDHVWSSNSSRTTTITTGAGGGGLVMDKLLTELEVPQYNMDVMMDPFWNQLRSPWLGNWSPYANVLNF